MGYDPSRKLSVWYDGDLVGENVYWSYEQASSGSYYALYLDGDTTSIQYFSSTDTWRFIVNGDDVTVPNSHALKMEISKWEGTVSEEFIQAVNMALNY